MMLASLWPSRNGRTLIEDLDVLTHESEEGYRPIKETSRTLLSPTWKATIVGDSGVDTAQQSCGSHS